MLTLRNILASADQAAGDGLFFGLLVLWYLYGFCLFCSFVLHGDSSMDYVSIPFNSLLYAHCRHD